MSRNPLHEPRTEGAGHHSSAPRLRAAAPRDERAPLRSNPARGRSGDGPAPRQRPRILLVDDEPKIRSLLRRALERRDFVCEEAASTLEALRVFERAPTDIVLSDINLPGADGIELIRRLAILAPQTAVLVVSGVDDSARAEDAFREGAYGYVLKPVLPEQVVLHVMAVLERQRRVRETEERKENLSRKLGETSTRLDDSHAQTVERLLMVASYRDEDEGPHGRRVGAYSGILARAIGWPSYLTSLLERAAPLHDLGKVAVSDSLLRKTGQFSDRDRSAVQVHCDAGHKILSGSGVAVLNMAATIAHRHHERWDGKGYPRGLKGDDIPLEARIVAVADVYDCLVTSRTYKPAWAEEVALKYLRENRGTQFEPRLVDAFIDHIFDVRAVPSTG